MAVANADCVGHHDWREITLTATLHLDKVKSPTCTMPRSLGSLTPTGAPMKDAPEFTLKVILYVGQYLVAVNVTLLDIQSFVTEGVSSRPRAPQRPLLVHRLSWWPRYSGFLPRREATNWSDMCDRACWYLRKFVIDVTTAAL